LKQFQNLKEKQNFGIVSTVWYVLVMFNFGIVSTVWYVLVMFNFGIVSTVWYVLVALASFSRYIYV
jgi:predicted outer membrane lipoprotein